MSCCEQNDTQINIADLRVKTKKRWYPKFGVAFVLDTLCPEIQEIGDSD